MGEMDDIYDKVSSFERYPRLNNILSDVKMNKKIKFESDGNVVSADKIIDSMKKNGIKPKFKVRDSIVYVVSEGLERFEFWISKENYTNLREIKSLKENNKNNLVGVTATITRINKDDASNTSFRVEPA